MILFVPTVHRIPDFHGWALSLPRGRQRPQPGPSWGSQTIEDGGTMGEPPAYFMLGNGTTVDFLPRHASFLPSQLLPYLYRYLLSTPNHRAQFSPFTSLVICLITCSSSLPFLPPFLPPCPPPTHGLALNTLPSLSLEFGISRLCLKGRREERGMMC